MSRRQTGHLSQQDGSTRTLDPASYYRDIVALLSDAKPWGLTLDVTRHIGLEQMTKERNIHVYRPSLVRYDIEYAAKRAREKADRRVKVKDVVFVVLFLSGAYYLSDSLETLLKGVLFYILLVATKYGVEKLCDTPSQSDDATWKTLPLLSKVSLFPMWVILVGDEDTLEPGQAIETFLGQHISTLYKNDLRTILLGSEEAEQAVIRSSMRYLWLDRRPTLPKLVLQLTTHLRMKVYHQDSQTNPNSFKTDLKEYLRLLQQRVHAPEQPTEAQQRAARFTQPRTDIQQWLVALQSSFDEIASYYASQTFLMLALLNQRGKLVGLTGDFILHELSPKIHEEIAIAAECWSLLGRFREQPDSSDRAEQDTDRVLALTCSAFLERQRKIGTSQATGPEACDGPRALPAPGRR